MKSQINHYSNYEKNLKREKEILDSIFEKLLKNKDEENTLKKLEQLIKSKIDIKNLIPYSKSFEGENILTLSKFWMVLILIKITQGRKHQEDFLTLVNSSLTHDLNEYEEYRAFFDDQCEQLFTDEEAIVRINKNPRMENKLEKPSKHEEVRSNYIYLLFRPEYFKKVKIQEMSKIKKTRESKDKSKSRTSNKSKSEISKSSNLNESEENDEKGDRLDEDDMLSKTRDTNKNKNNKGKNKTTSFKKKKEDE